MSSQFFTMPSDTGYLMSNICRTSAASFPTMISCGLSSASMRLERPARHGQSGTAAGAEQRTLSSISSTASVRIIGRPTIAGNCARTRLSPAKPALTYCTTHGPSISESSGDESAVGLLTPVPLSHTITFSRLVSGSGSAILDALCKSSSAGGHQRLRAPALALSRGTSHGMAAAAPACLPSEGGL